jgi:hypothetical protein
MSVQKKICDLNIPVTEDALKLTTSGKDNYINLTSDGEQLTANRSLGDQLKNNIELPIMHYTQGDTKLEEIQAGQDDANKIQAISSAVACVKVTSNMMKDTLNTLSTSSTSSTSGITPQPDCYVCLYANYVNDFADLSASASVTINNVNVGFHLFANAMQGKLLNINSGSSSESIDYVLTDTTNWGTTNKKAGYPEGYHQQDLTTEVVNYIYVRAKQYGSDDDTAKDYLCVLVKTGVDISNAPFVREGSSIDLFSYLSNESLSDLSQLITPVKPAPVVSEPTYNCQTGVTNNIQLHCANGSLDSQQDVYVSFDPQFETDDIHVIVDYCKMDFCTKHGDRYNNTKIDFNVTGINRIGFRIEIINNDKKPWYELSFRWMAFHINNISVGGSCSYKINYKLM